MLSRTLSTAARRALHVSAAARAEAATPEAAAASELVLNLAVPARALVFKKAVKRVTLPGRGGTFGLEKNSPPVLSELRPGIVRVDHLDNSVEEYFIPGGFAFKHANNVIDVSSPESAALDQIDADALRAANSEATKKRDGAAPGSKEHAEANLALETYKALGQALKVQL
jgi:F-type H+-transporting ATPase subunit epsilon